MRLTAAAGYLPPRPRRGRKVIRAVVSFALVAAGAAGSMASYWVLVRSVLPGLRLSEGRWSTSAPPQWRIRCPRAAPWPRVGWAMLFSRGISTADYLLYTLVSGIWSFARLGLPVLALLVLVTASPPGAP